MTRLLFRACAAVLTALTTLGVLVRTPASEAQSVSNFAADVDTAITRGLDYLDRFGAFGVGGDGRAWSGSAAGLVSLALLEKRVDASATAVSQGYARATAGDKIKIDRMVRSMVLYRNDPFEAYQNGSELMALSLYVRTGGLQSTAPDAGTGALDALDRAVDEALDPIDFTDPLNPTIDDPYTAGVQTIPWTGYWTYHVAGGYDASGTQFVIAGLSAARGAYMQADRGGRLAKINHALAYTRKVYAPTVDPFYDHGLVGEACSPGGSLTPSERGKGYGLPWIVCSPGPIVQGVSNSSQQTASGLWIQLVGGSNLNSTGIQAYLQWLRNRYQHSSLQGQAFAPESYGYYLWTATKAFEFLDRSAAVPDPGNLSTADLGITAPGTGTVWSQAELRMDPATAVRPATFGPGGAGYYADARETSRWYFDFAYNVISRQCFAGAPASLAVPPSNAGWEGIPLNPCTSGGNDGYFVPVNGRWPGWEKNVAEQVFHILVLQRALGGSCIDTDNDGLCDTEDNCAAVSNQDQADGDGDGLGDVCDNCQFYNPDQLDSDSNGVGNVCATPPTVVANDDSGTVPTAGGVAVVSVLTNDSLNDLAVLPTAVNTAFVSSTHPNVGLSGNSVIVAADTPVGVYTLIYRICEVLNPDNCDGATVTVTVTEGAGAVIDAVNDAAPVVDGFTGNANVLDVLADNGSGPDTLDGVPGTAGTVTVVSFTSDHAGVTLSGSTLQVAPHTPTGTYNLHYRLCVAVALTPCDEADVTVPVVMPGIDAIDDEGAAVSSALGGVSFANVLVNDTLGPLPAATVVAQLDVVEISSTDPGVYLDGVSVVVAPGTTPGDHILEYEICETVSEGANCDSALVTVPVKMAFLVANDDTGVAVNGMTGGTSFANILVNDTEDGQPATAANLDIVEISSTSLGVFLDGVDVKVAPGTPAGSYELVYEICLTESQGGSCDEATVFVTVTWAPIDAVNDAGAPVVGVAGGVSVPNVVVNDTLSGTPVDIAAVVLSYVTGSPGLTLDTATGSVTVASGTPASPVGSPYTLTYRLCEQLNPTNCDTAVVTVPVIAAPIVAADDTGTPVNGVSGGLALLSVLPNDTLNGVPVALGSVIVTYVGGTPGLSLTTADASVWVAAGTPANPAATLTYRICEKANPTNCDEAVVTTPVLAPPIIALDDVSGGVNGAAGGLALPNVLVNDLLNGAEAVLTTVTLSYVNGSAGLVLNPATGAVTVMPGTPENLGATLTYRICEILNPLNCDDAVVTVPIVASPIDAVDDEGAPVNGLTGGTSFASVYAADTLGAAPVVPTDVTVAFVSSEHPNIGLTGTSVTVAAGTPAGNYRLVYRLCEVLNPGNCDEAVVSVTVTAAPIDAVDNAGAPVNGLTGGTSFTNVLVNDTLNGQLVAAEDVDVTQVAPHDYLSLSGLDVVVAPGTPAGNAYYLDYRICEILNPTNCDEARVTVPVTAPVIDAVDDTGVAVSGATGGQSVAAVFANDTLNGAAFAPEAVALSLVNTTHPGVGFTGVGNEVGVQPGTPAGNYVVRYRICDVVNPTNCDEADVTVPVLAGVIDAVDDLGASVNGAIGGTSFIGVLDNDTLNGAPATSGAVLTFVSATHPGVTLVGASVEVAPGTPAGNYSLVYEICEGLNPGNCDTAVVTVPVTAAPIVAVDDLGDAVNGASGGRALLSVLPNDTLNGQPVAPGAVTLTYVGGTAGVTLNTADASVWVTAGTAANPAATLTYRVCENVNPTNCDEAVVTTPILAAPIVALDDLSGGINGAVGGPALPNVLVNDLLNGAEAVLTTVTLQHLGGTAGLVLNPATGAVTVTPGTPANPGATLDYRICEILNPANCDDAVVTVPILSSPIDAVDDTGAPIVGVAGGQALATVLVNDTLNGAAATLANVTLSFVSGTAGLTLNAATGAVMVAAGTAANTAATLTYRACETLNPTNCDEATVTVPILAAAIDAVNDAGASVNGASGGVALATVIANDTLNGAAAALANVTIAFVSGPAGLSLNPVTGEVTVAPGTAASPAGSPYQLTYRLCEAINPGNCDEAVVTVPVVAAVIDAVNDAGSVNSLTGGTAVPNVLGNDTLNSALAASGLVTTTQLSTTHAGVTLSGTGVVVAAGTPAGVYTLNYSICEVLNAGNCDQAVVTVTVTAPVIDAVNDAGTADGEAGGTAVTDVLENDTLNGTPVVPGTVTLSPVSSTHAGVTLSGTSVVVAAGTPAGSYTLVYQICENLNPTNCDDATVTVTVTAPVIDAVDDTGAAVNGATGGTSFTNVLGNDTLNGASVVAANVTLSQVSSTHVGVMLVGANVVVAAGTPAGNYTLVYRLCENLNPTNCDDATVTVTVTAPVIDAVDDAGAAVNGATGETSVTNVLANDLLDGVAVVAANVTLSQVSSTHAGVTLVGADVVVAAGTPAGNYTLVYRICENLNPTNCDTATVSVPVTAPVIDAVDDTGVAVNGANGGTSFTNVLGNDTLNGAPVVASKVTTSLVSSTHAGVTLSGVNVIVAPATPADTYTLVYQICEVLNPSNCDQATVTVTVTPPVIDAVDDSGSVNGFTGGTAVANVLANDTLNGAPAVLGAVTISFLSSAHPGVTLSGTSVLVSSGTPSGVYALNYEICEVLNPDNCSIGVVTVTVTAAGIVALDDSGTVDASTGGTAVANILANDTLNGVVPTTAQVTVTIVSTLPAGITLSGTAVNVAAGTPTGTYTFDYRICDKLNSNNCDSATVTITVRGFEDGRMTGGGSVFRVNGQRVTHGFELHCRTTALPNNLQVNWGNGKKAQTFHLEALTTVSCSDDPRIVPEQPQTKFDTMVGTGVGRFNGVAGATVSFTLTDAGEPGTKDFASIVVKDSRGRVVMEVKGNLQNGNQQAHRSN